MYLNNYKILKPIWFSEKSTIYEAYDEKLQKKLALKIFNSDFLTETIVNNIQDNTIYSSYMSINHVNINKCNDILIVEDGLVLISDYLNGNNLDDVIKEKGRLPYHEFTVLMNQIIDAFNHAHKKGVIHGNLTASDIFIQENGNIKILGFEQWVLYGLNYEAQLQNQGARSFITPEEILIGTNFIDQQSDIYSVGLILFYALTGLNPNFYCGYKFPSSLVYNPFPDYKFKESEKKIQLIIEKACQLSKNDRYESFEIWKSEIDTFPNHNSVQVT